MRPRSSRTSNRGERPDRASCGTRGRTTRRWATCVLDTSTGPRTTVRTTSRWLGSWRARWSFRTHPRRRARPASGAGRCHNSPRPMAPRSWASRPYGIADDLLATPQTGRPTYSCKQGPMGGSSQVPALLAHQLVLVRATSSATRSPVSSPMACNCAATTSTARQDSCSMRLTSSNSSSKQTRMASGVGD